MSKFSQAVYEAASFIPQGKVITYQALADLIGSASPRAVGNALHQNPDESKIPCHRVVNTSGHLAQNFAFGGLKGQKQKLITDGVVVIDNQVDLTKYLWHPHQLLTTYYKLLNDFGRPGPWPWFDQGDPHTPDEITIGAILTQNTSWPNVQKSLDVLRSVKQNDLASLYHSSQTDLESLKTYIKSSGFFNQKAQYLANFCQFLFENYGNSANFYENCDLLMREKLLHLKGIGKETADTILLYAAHQPIFVIDAYTKRFAKHYDLPIEPTYNELQNYFTKNLPVDVSLYQDFHALIVRWAQKTARSYSSSERRESRSLKTKNMII